MPGGKNLRDEQLLFYCKMLYEVINGSNEVQVSGSFSTSGLKVAGLHTLEPINDSSWTALPLTAQSGRNAISIQNNTGFEMKINYVTGGGYIGMTIPDGAERSYDITDAIIIYGRLESGAGTKSVDVEELA